MDLVKVLEAADKLRSEIVPCFIGEPGIGKTQAVYEFARKHGRNVVEIIASQILPNEVSGITMPVAETHSMEVFDHARLSSLKDGDVLFFDELLQAQPSTLAACLTLIQERRLMSGKMLPDVLIVAAANPLANPNLIPMSIRQRFMFVNVSFDRDAWEEYVNSALGIKMTESVKNIPSFNDVDYNVPTPRTVMKLLQWLKKSGCDKDVQGAITNMFDGHTVQVMVECLNPPKDTLTRIKEVAEQFDNDLDLGKVTSVQELMQLLESSPAWNIIRHELEHLDTEGEPIDD